MTNPLLIDNHQYDKFQIIFLPSRYSGFSAMVTYILNGVRKALEMNYLPVAYVDKENARFFYEPALGENIWDYYFEPPMEITYGQVQELLAMGKISQAQLFQEKARTLRNWQQNDPDRVITYWGNKFGENPETKAAFMKEKRALGREYVKKFLKVKPKILAKTEQYFDSGIDPTQLIGIHIRGTDFAYATATPIERYYTELDSLFQQEEYESHNIFVATDQKQFIGKFKERYGEERIVTYDSFRGEGGIAPYRLKGALPYKKGEDVLIDILILSRCDYIIKSASAVGELALWFTDNDEFTDLALETKRVRLKDHKRLPAYISLNVDNLNPSVLKMRMFLVKALKYVVRKFPGGEEIKNYLQGKWY